MKASAPPDSWSQRSICLPVKWAQRFFLPRPSSLGLHRSTDGREIPPYKLGVKPQHAAAGTGVCHVSADAERDSGSTRGTFSVSASPLSEY